MVFKGALTIKTKRMKPNCRVTPRIIAEVKKYLKTDYISVAAKKVGISYTTAWHIAQGHYDRFQYSKKLVTTDICPITGFRSWQ